MATQRTDGSSKQTNGGRGMRNPEALGTALGWFSIGLGAAQVVAPRRMARLIGVKDDGTSTNTMVAIGVREITAGVGLLTQRRRAPWAWGRVAGDAMDLALLGNALISDDNDRGRTTAATAAVLGVTAVDVLCAQWLTSGRGERVQGRVNGSGIRVRRSITVDRPPEEVYRFWRNFENLPRFMDHLEAVRVTDDRRSHWQAKGPAGTTIEWDAEVTEDRPGDIIAWRSVGGADVRNLGVVRFRPAPGRRGTEVQVDLRYEPPAGKLGATIAKLFGEEPGVQVAGDLRRFKQVVETGEVVYSDASIHTGMHPAQPPKARMGPPRDRENPLVLERSADAAAVSSNRDRTSTTARGRAQEARA